MTIEEVKKFINENKESGEVKAYLQGLVSVEGVKKYLSENEDGRKWLDSERDKHLSKGLDTWKTNNFQKEIDRRITELYPAETDEKKQLRELNLKIEKMESEKQREVLKNKALTIASEKKLPINQIIDLVIAGDEETTVSNINKFEEIFGSSVQLAVEERLKTSGYTPPINASGNTQPKDLNEALKNYYTEKNKG
ncbi:DUF4355 domain-containing protein [Clostridium sp.]|uniref:DUF4355 domain-containing protein n=1 Tax=Clostridium sp. TaxID=1506 RepID=UPI001A40F8E6|nr:DUF4355 domain-containing protein [Clostridium sp.]MBK5242055.1 DUF4355 domain-containing protein [Clostridium sp.]